MALRSGFSDILAPGFASIFRQNMDIRQYPELYSRVFKIANSERQYEEHNLVAGFGSMPKKNEGEGVTYDDPIQGNKKRYTHLTYALAFRVSRELFEDDLYSIMRTMPEELAFSARDAVENTSVDIFINGFTDATANHGPDGEPLFGDGTTKDHPLLGGGVGSNQLSTAMDLHADSLEVAITLMEDTVNDRGLLIRLIPKLLIVPTELQFIAKELMESELRPFTANNQVNPFKDMDMKYFVWPYLTDPDAWFLQGHRHYLTFYWRTRAQFRNDDDFDTDDAKFKARQRFSVGFLDWRGIVGSPGAS